MGRVRSIALVLALLAAVPALAGCGSGGGDSGNDGAEDLATTATTAAPTTTTEAAVADVSGDWTMTLTIAETVPPGIELAPENQTKERALTLAVGDCPAPADFVQTGEPTPGTPTNSPGDVEGDCVGSADVATRDFVNENLPLLATADGFTVAVHAEAQCFDSATGVADPNSTYTHEAVYSFTVTSDDSSTTPTELTGTLVETDGADNTCPGLTGATGLTYDLVAVPA